MLSFLLLILVGSLLLKLPISTRSRVPVPYLDALFTATTSVCVTGLVTLPTVTTWSVFGQIVILILIQIGGLGLITFMAGLMIILHKRLGLNDRFLLQDAFNLNSITGVVKFIRKVLIGTFVVEGSGALMYMTVFIPQFGLKGIWISVFNAISAFCNAGIDIISVDSLVDYVKNPMVNLTTSLLIILSGIGFVVWWDVLAVSKRVPRYGLKAYRELNLHSKLAISSTIALLLGGTLLFLIFEYHNPNTIGSFSFPEKLQAAFFQSVTTRTAGFAMLPQKELTNASAISALLLMFIGGSPVGTAGGVKTVTMTVLLASAFAQIRNRSEVTMFHRTISKEAISKAVAVVTMSFLIMFVSTVLLSSCTRADAMDIFYETVSATATVGLSRNLTPFLGPVGKMIIILTMYLGRVGPISLAIAFKIRKEDKNIIKDPVEKISVG
ncbi:MAG: potassium transporter KtrB [Firmicutes bacterium]|nr:potassium transporter KtrB [Bacillota bacterium]